jgi:hypothetical protein
MLILFMTLWMIAAAYSTYTGETDLEKIEGMLCMVISQGYLASEMIVNTLKKGTS